MNIKLQLPKISELKPRITVMGVGGAGGNAIENMISSGLDGVEFVVANTDAQALSLSSAERVLQLGVGLTEGLGAGSRPEIGEAAAEEAMDEIRAQVSGSHMVFIAAGMGGGTGTGAAAVIARVARELGILTVAIVTKPFLFEGTRRMRVAKDGITALRPHVDTLIVIPNQNLFRIADEKTTFSDAFVLADQVLHSGISCIVDLIIRDGLINLDFADVKTVMQGMGDAVMGTGEAGGDERAERAAEQAIANPLLDNVSLHGARGLLVSIAGGKSLTLYEVDEAANRVKREVDPEANIIIGATIDETLDDRLRVSIVASGMNGQGATGAWHGATAGEYAAAPSPDDGWGMPDAGPPMLDHYADEVSSGGPMPPPLPEWPDPDRSVADRADEGDDIAAALSEAIGQADQPDWESSNGVQIHEVPPEFSESSLGEGGDRHRRAGAEANTRSQDSSTEFTPRMTEAVRRPVPRMPGVEDFPIVGQREYHAKRQSQQQAREVRDGVPGDWRDGHRDEGSGNLPPSKKPTLLERITGVRRRPSDSQNTVRQDHVEDAASDRKAGAAGLGEQVRPRWAEASAGDRRDVSEDADFPDIFRNQRRR